MIFQNIDFHNVDEIQPFEDGWKLYRAPQSVLTQCNEGLQNSAAYGSGVELRFVLQGKYADIRLRTIPLPEGQMAHLFFGSIQGGWQQSAFTITDRETVIRINKPDNMAQLWEITNMHHLPFSPEVVRLVLPYGNNIFLGAEGDITPPAPEMLPKRTLLSYGSSITHGSLALGTPGTYPFRLAGKLGMDSLNKGFAGTCHCEKAMAQWLSARKDWHVMTLEMGINMMGMDEQLFEQRIDDFTAVMAADGRPVFATSIFHFHGDHYGAGQTKAERYRAIVRKYAEPRLHFVDGLALLERSDFISQDMVHPSLEGILQIADRWAEIIRQGLAK